MLLQTDLLCRRTAHGSPRLTKKSLVGREGSACLGWIHAKLMRFLEVHIQAKTHSVMLYAYFRHVDVHRRRVDLLVQGRAGQLAEARFLYHLHFLWGFVDNKI